MRRKKMSPAIFPVHELWSLLDRVHFAIARLRCLELAQFDLTIEQSSILYVLRNRGGAVTTRELEDVTMRQHHSISALVNRMIKMGLVKKEKGETGKRFNITMTKEGQTTSKKVPITSIEMAFSFLTAREKQRLAALSSLLLDRARDLLGICYKPPFLQNIISAGAADVIMKKKIRKNEVFPDHELWSLLDRASFVISRLRELELAQFGLTIEQSSILYILRNRGGVATTGELEDITMRQQCSISTLVNRMAGMRLVDKEKNENSRRFKIVMTDEGLALSQNTPIKSLEMTFSVLDETEKHEMATLLSSLLNRARDLLGIGYRPPFLQNIEDIQHAYLANS